MDAKIISIDIDDKIKSSFDDDKNPTYCFNLKLNFNTGESESGKLEIWSYDNANDLDSNYLIWHLETEYNLDPHWDFINKYIKNIDKELVDDLFIRMFNKIRNDLRNVYINNICFTEQMIKKFFNSSLNEFLEDQKTLDLLKV
jgi:hypothetical protein